MATPPPIPNQDRIAIYTPVASAGPFPLGFTLYDTGGTDIIVTLDGVEQLGNWSIAANPSPDAPSTWVDCTLTFAGPVTGLLSIAGSRPPRRVGQYQEGRGVPARDQNTEWNILTAIARELYRRAGASESNLRDETTARINADNVERLARIAADDILDARLDAAEPVLSDVANRAVRVPLGELGQVLPPTASRARRFLGFNDAGVPIPADISVSVIPSGVEYASLLTAAGTAIPAPLTYIRTLGYGTAGDKGGALYRRIATPVPAKAWHFQSADGAWWQIAEPMLTTRMFGAVGDGVAVDNTPIANAFEASAALSAPVDLGGADKTYRITAQIPLSSNMNVISNGALLDMSGVPNDVSGFYAAGTARTDAPGTALLTADANERDYSVSVGAGQSSKFAVDEDVLITSEARYGYAPNDNVNKGEFAKVRFVGVGVSLCTPLLNTHTTATTATIRKVNWVSGLRLKGLRIRSGGSSTNGHRGIRLNYCRDFIIENCQIDGQHVAQIEMNGCLRGLVRGGFCRGVFFDGVTGYNFYGVAVYHSREILVDGVVGERTRHLGVIGAYSAGAGYWGESSFVTFANCKAIDCQAASFGPPEGVSYGFENHTVGSFIAFLNCTVDGCYSGFHVKGGRDVLISGCLVRNYAFAVVSFGSTSTGATTRDVLVTGVKGSGHYGPLSDARIAGIAFMPGSGTTIKNIKVTGCHFTDLRDRLSTKGRAVYAAAGTYIDCEIDNNLFDAGPTSVATDWAIQLASAHGFKVRNNTIIGFQNGIFLDACNDTVVDGNTIKINGATAGAGAGVYSRGARNRIRNNNCQNIYKGIEIDAASTGYLVGGNVASGLGGTMVTVQGGATGITPYDNNAI